MYIQQILKKYILLIPLIYALRTFGVLLKQKQLLYLLKAYNCNFKLLVNSFSKSFQLAWLNRNKISKVMHNKQLLFDIVIFIIHIKMTNTNTFIHIKDVRGNLKVTYTSGMTQSKGKRKTKQPKAFKLLLKLLKKNLEFLREFPVALHLTNFNKRKEKFVIKYLSQELFICTVRNYNKQPFNGCRTRKLRRIKGIKINFK